ncbi:two-component sensor histidine kinase, partial [bacterium]|nr:two-component sensor histidine kinase [bacterium]
MDANSPCDSSRPARTTPPRGIRRSFRAKLFTVTAAGIIILSAVFTTFFLANQHSVLHDKLVSEGQLLTRLLVHNARLGLFAGNSNQLTDLTAGAMTVPGVLEVAIIGRDGQPLARMTRDNGRRTGLTLDFSEPVFALQASGSEEDIYFAPAEEPG